MKTVSIRWLHIVSRPTGMLFWECVGPLKKMAKKGHFCDIFKLLVFKNIGIPLTFEVKYGMLNMLQE